MTEKKNPNPFVNLANEAKKTKHPGLGKAPRAQGPKPNTKGFGGASVVRRSGRGG